MTFLLVNYIFPLPKKKIAMFLQEKDIFIFPFVSAKNIFFFLHILYTSKFMLTFICVSNFTRRQRTLGRNLNIRKKVDNTWGFFKFFLQIFGPRLNKFSVTRAMKMWEICLLFLRQTFNVLIIPPLSYTDIALKTDWEERKIKIRFFRHQLIINGKYANK